MRDYIGVAVLGLGCLIVSVIVIAAIVRYFAFILSVLFLSVFIALFLQAIYPIVKKSRRRKGKRRHFR